MFIFLHKSLTQVPDLDPDCISQSNVTHALIIIIITITITNNGKNTGSHKFPKINIISAMLKKFLMTNN